MSDNPLGKIDRALFDRSIRKRLGHSDPAVLIGPQHGVDAAILDIGDQVLAITTDPFFVVPEYGWERAGWFAVHILASDVVTSGLPPRFLSVDLNLPPSMSNEDLDAMWTAVHDACNDLQVSIVTGHTGRYEGCAFPMVGGATMLAQGGHDRYVSTTMAKAGDIVIMTKGAAIEATALMAVTYPDLVSRRVGEDLTRRAQDLFWDMSVVKDALAAVSVGVRTEGVTAMHDATEGGVLGGLCEIADASQVGMSIDESAIPVPEPVRAVCDAFDMGPLASISEGTLLLTCTPHRAPDVLAVLRDAEIDAAAIGECTGDVSERVLFGERGKLPLVPPDFDPFWPAFAKAAEESNS